MGSAYPKRRGNRLTVSILRLLFTKASKPVKVVWQQGMTIHPFAL